LWLGTAVAFSRVLLDLVHSLFETDACWSILLPIPLIAICIGRDTPASRGAGAGGGLLILLGLVLNVLGMSLDAWSIARLGLPLAAIGVARITGQPALPVALMSLWLVPLPYSILTVLTPWPESGLASLAAAVTTQLGAPLHAAGPVIHGPAGKLLLDPDHSGLPLAVGLALLGWYGALRRGGGLSKPLRAAALGFVLAFPIQAFGVCVAALALWSGSPGVGQALVEWGLLAVCSVTSVLWIELHTQRGHTDSPEG
jgi:hypothetical protein